MADKAVTIIFNPVSGSGRARKLATRLDRALAAMGLPTRLEPTARAGDGTRIARHREPESRAVMAVGGDGTIREVVAGLSCGETPLAVLPAGTSNVLALALGLPRGPEKAARMVAAGHTRQLDLMEADRPGGQRERSLLFVGAGFGAEAVHRLHRGRRRRLERGGSGNITKINYLPPILGALRTLPPPALEVRVDGHPLPGGPWGWVIVTNIPKYAGNLVLDPAIRPDDGLLDVIALRADNPFNLARHAVAGFLGILHRVRDLGRACAAREVLIQARGEWPVQIDGDPAGRAPLLVRCGEKKMPVLVPTPSPERKE